MKRLSFWNFSQTFRSEAPSEIHFSDWLLKQSIRIVALAFIALLGGIGYFLLSSAWPTLRKFGFYFLIQPTWDPVHEVFGAFPVLYGTLMSSCIALLIAAPLSIAAALWTHEIAPLHLRRVISFLIEMLAAIPSIIYGLWGIFVLAPLLRTKIEPLLGHLFGALPWFQGPAYGVGMLAAGMILAMMVTPTLFVFATELFKTVPTAQREAALALGATRWEMMQMAVLHSTKGGLLGSMILALGRAMGETMAVTLVIGNHSGFSSSLFAPAQTMASIIANEYIEASSELHLAALGEVGLLLFAVTGIMNALARIFIFKQSGQTST